MLTGAEEGSGPGDTAPDSSNALLGSVIKLGGGILGIAGKIGESANVNITFKILYNDAVAMTGGQKAIGGATPWAISKQLAAEGVKKIYVVSDELHVHIRLI